MYDYKVQSQITGQQFLTEWLLREFKMDSLWTTVFIAIEEKNVFRFLGEFFDVFRFFLKIPNGNLNRK